MNRNLKYLKIKQSLNNSQNYIKLTRRIQNKRLKFTEIKRNNLNLTQTNQKILRILSTIDSKSILDVDCISYSKRIIGLKSSPYNFEFVFKNLEDNKNEYPNTFKLYTSIKDYEYNLFFKILKPIKQKNQTKKFFGKVIINKNPRIIQIYSFTFLITCKLNKITYIFDGKLGKSFTKINKIAINKTQVNHTDKFEDDKIQYIQWDRIGPNFKDYLKKVFLSVNLQNSEFRIIYGTEKYLQDVKMHKFYKGINNFL